MTVAFLWVQLALAAGVILGASQFLAKSADIIAEKTGLGRSFVGVVLLATATSLPELGTGVSSIALVGQPDLAGGDAFGSNVFNLLIISLLDLRWRNGPVLNAVSQTSVLVGALGIAVITLGVIAIFIHGQSTAIAGWYVSPVSVMMVALLVGGMFLIYRHGAAHDPGEAAEAVETQYGDASLSKGITTYAISAAVVVLTAFWLSRTGDLLAKEMDWEASFVGTQFLALSTSLPELATSFAAIRLNAPELAITNVLGSNLFNMGLVIFLDDVVYTQGVLWGGISQVHMLTGGIAILMTSVVIVAILIRPHPRLGRFWTIEGAALMAAYVAASALVFYLA